VNPSPIEKAVLEYRSALVMYLQHKVLVEDWHGVSDAANDLREVDAHLRGIRERRA
jgi:hypothetical protein